MSRRNRKRKESEESDGIKSFSGGKRGSSMWIQTPIVKECLSKGSSLVITGGVGFARKNQETRNASVFADPHG